jgi:hypothetical protein
MPRLALRLDPARDDSMTPWLAVRLTQHLVNTVRDELGLPPVSDAEIREVLRQLVQHGPEAPTPQAEGPTPWPN